MNYHFKIHKEKKGYWAECLELKGCQTQADHMENLKINMHEALNLYLDEPEDSKLIHPLPQKKVKDNRIIEVAVKPDIAFSFLLRRERLLSGLTQHEMKNLLEFKSVFAYQKLEKSKYGNPTLKSLLKIKKIFPRFPLDLILG